MGASGRGSDEWIEAAVDPAVVGEDGGSGSSLRDHVGPLLAAVSAVVNVLKQQLCFPSH